MADDRISELGTKLAVLHFLVHNLMVAHCEKEQDPAAFAQRLLSEIDAALAEAPTDEQWQIEIREQMQVFFGLVVSTLRSKTSHHNA